MPPIAPQLHWVEGSVICYNPLNGTEYSPHHGWPVLLDSVLGWESNGSPNFPPFFQLVASKSVATPAFPVIMIWGIPKKGLVMGFTNPALGQKGLKTNYGLRHLTLP